MKKLEVEAKVENLAAVMAFVDEILEEAECSVKAQMQIDIAVEEIFTNVAYYAYAPETGDAVVQVEITSEPRCAVLTFADHGMQYNPLAKADPDVTLSAEERNIGGLGIFMVKKSMDEVSYEYRDSQNIFTIKKKI